MVSSRRSGGGARASLGSGAAGCGATRGRAPLVPSTPTEWKKSPDMAYDLLVRNGRLIDGTGGPAREGDVAIQDGRIVAVGRVDGPARREIDADGRAVMPGFVDVHTHYDGQATWDPDLAPSVYHGVTTAVMGNCGVGFAPVRPGQEGFLIELMEGVEDIPGTTLHEGIDWSWESFPEYLEALEGRRFTMDLGTQVPHGSIRAYVMGVAGSLRAPRSPIT